MSVSPQSPAAQRGPNNRRRGINENYAREVMELHTLGVDGGYTQKDIQEVARCFTGWTIERPRGEGEFRFEQRFHDNGAKTVLGTHIAAGGGMEDGLKVIDILANHPATAKFIATKLARRFVADDPPATVVSKASAVFQQSGGRYRVRSPRDHRFAGILFRRVLPEQGEKTPRICRQRATSYRMLRPRLPTLCCAI